MIRLVLDTNVVLDLLHFGDPAVAPLRQALRDGRAAAFGNAACRGELAHVLSRAEFKIGDDDVRRMLEAYDALVRPCDAVADGNLPPCRDADDQKFLELAQAARADLLVTKDKALLALAKKARRLGFRIATPAGMATVLEGI
ncbi:MAG: putative toxin-antitoxin system toxin component, PIN family [Burkholderiales bacterium]|jgi:putative PIN family toxin of toxin-antitoxin system|uniref:Toxin-antitoxin system toxin component, PIN family n=1 Tax=Candidatus Desulfobacillus denitrificans TaxID=2608985 RepID=A0A809RXQ4_9PROT|nr:putative toxin-antitoxin system toxin component, PIN family [Rhodocyclaceae bacterium]MCZ2173790.1 putative toxin-antitoxin system toxin component, PIN family [Burkholderiales bacterium]MEB2315920.1 putative toxin-antitoxin system toxin component, PIN family [Xanthomonadaceae bacterium]OQY70554.1 MAG: putative toxin-antitoxin system toxin component, PIN family [Rhodocyclaceae bacterium UTPRO2]BBO21137.1 toxin-antitoxin system toxin component, PIN family [Candidatus Desulfobacillus denitrific